MRPAFGFVDDAGHFTLDDRKGFLATVGHEFKGKEVAVTVHTRAYQRSINANAYYWAVVVKMATEATGQGGDDIHAVWCDQFITSERKQIEFFHHMTGTRVRYTVDPARSSKLNGTKFYDYVDLCRLWLQEWYGVTTPDPDREYWRKRVTVRAV